MITWRKVSENTTRTFECHEVLCDTNLITLTVLSETRYTVRWYRNGDLDLKKSFDATDLEDAKEYAISAVKEILNYRASYWKTLKTNSTPVWIDRLKGRLYESQNLL